MNYAVKDGTRIEAMRAGEVLDLDGNVRKVSEEWDFEAGIQDAIKNGTEEVIGERWAFVSGNSLHIGARATAALDPRAIKARAYQGGLDAARVEAARVALNDPDFESFCEALEQGCEIVAEVARSVGFEVSVTDVQREARWA